MTGWRAADHEVSCRGETGDRGEDRIVPDFRVGGAGQKGDRVSGGRVIAGQEDGMAAGDEGQR